jgi:DNA-binding XRE family transcriptional regulator
MRNTRAVPNQIPATGGTVSMQFEARTSLAPATAAVRYSVAAGFPYRVTGGDSASPAVTTTEKTVSQNVTIARTQQTPVSFIQMQVTASIPGDVSQTHTCFVWIENPIGEHLRSFRQTNKISQSSLAERLGVSPATISRIESGRFPSAELEVAIAEVIL